MQMSITAYRGDGSRSCRKRDQRVTSGEKPVQRETAVITMGCSLLHGRKNKDNRVATAALKRKQRVARKPSRAHRCGSNYRAGNDEKKEIHTRDTMERIQGGRKSGRSCPRSGRRVVLQKKKKNQNQDDGNRKKRGMSRTKKRSTVGEDSKEKWTLNRLIRTQFTVVRKRIDRTFKKINPRKAKKSPRKSGPRGAKEETNVWANGNIHV